MQHDSKKFLIVGFGDLGAEVGRQLVAANMQVVGVRRSNAVAADNVSIINADVTQPMSLCVLEDVNPAIIIYCVAANGQSDAEYKAAYVDGLRNVLSTQNNNTELKHVFFVSSTRVYGQDIDGLLDETITAIPADFGGERLLEAEGLLSHLHCNATVLRLSGIYGPDRLRMINLAKAPDAWPKQNSWSNRIHRDDAAAFMVFLCQQVLSQQLLAQQIVKDCYIVTDSKPVPQYEVLSWIADETGNSKPMLIPAMGGKRLNNKRLLATGFKLQYPDYQKGYGALLAQARKQD